MDTKDLSKVQKDRNVKLEKLRSEGFDYPNDFEKKYQIESLEFLNKRRWDINLYGDVKLMLSEEDPNASIQNFIMIQNKLSETDINNVKTYDLRNLKKTILINLND